MKICHGAWCFSQYELHKYRRERERITIAQHVTQNRCVYRRSLMFVCPFLSFFLSFFLFFCAQRVLFTHGVATREDGESGVEIRWQSWALRVVRLLLWKCTRSLLFDGLIRREKLEKIISRRRVYVCFALHEIATFTERARKCREKYHVGSYIKANLPDCVRQVMRIYKENVKELEVHVIIIDLYNKL